MNPFRVWLSPIDSTCKVRVDGISNARWLLTRLSQFFLFKSAEPIHEEQDSSCCNFRVEYNFQMSHPKFQRLMAAIPEVEVILIPA